MRKALPETTLAVMATLSGSGCAVQPHVAALDRLSQRLLAANSATKTLEAWCAERGLADPARVRAEKLDGPAPALTPEQRALLQVSPDEPIGFRHVRLMCGDIVLSDAQNWFVPSRLTADMRRTLATTDTPYGRVILPLDPIRRNEQVAVGADDPPGTVFKHRGLVSSADGVPLALVEERYQRGLAGDR